MQAVARRTGVLIRRGWSMMEQLLSRPEIQSAVVPFVVAFAVYFGLQKVTERAWLWALLAAFLAAAGLINGLTVTPLTGTRKIILLVIASFFMAALLPQDMPGQNLQRSSVFPHGLAAVEHNIQKHLS